MECFNGEKKVQESNDRLDEVEDPLDNKSKLLLSSSSVVEMDNAKHISLVVLPMTDELKNNNFTIDCEILQQTDSKKTDSISCDLKPLKKACPLEESIKAANLDSEFEEEASYSALNGAAAIGHSVNASILPTLIPCGQSNGVAAPFTNQLAGTAYSTADPFALTIHPAPVTAEPIQVLLVQVQQQVQETVKPAVVMATPALIPAPLSTNAVATVTISDDTVSVPVPSPAVVQPDRLAEHLVPVNSIQPSAIQQAQDKAQPFTTGNEEGSDRETMICEVDASDDDSTSLVSEEQDEEIVEETLVLKIRKVPSKARKRNVTEGKLENGEESWERVKRPRRTRPPHRDVSDNSSDASDWSASDDESLAGMVKRSPEGNSDSKGIKRALKCCSRLCHIKILPENQEKVLRNFRDLEERGQGDRYLANCLQLCPKESTGNKALPQQLSIVDAEPPPSPWPSLDDDIANESNGNQTLSDQIQHAINESLRDQETAQEVKEETSSMEVRKNRDESKENNDVDKIDCWTFYIVVNNRLRMVCLHFLLAVLQIPESRISLLQERILNGDILDRLPVTARMMKSSDVWPVAKRHLDSLPTEPVPYCKSTPRHRYLIEGIDRRTLFQRFREFYMQEIGKEINIRFDTYRRYVLTNSNIAFKRLRETSCAACDWVESQLTYKATGTKAQTLKEKGLKLKNRTKIKESIQNGDLQEKKVKKKKSVNGRTCARRNMGPKKGQRGDVFSLMLTHLETVPSVVPRFCYALQPHRFFSPATITIQMLYEEYRKYFLKQTNSELGLRYAIYESLFLRNPYFTIADVESDDGHCPKCLANPVPPKDKKQKKHKDCKKKSKSATSR